MKRVGFLFNHDAAHQVAHIAGIAQELATRFPEIHVIALYSRPALRAAVEAICGEEAAARIEWVHLRPSRAVRGLAALADRVLPLTRLAALLHNLDLFASLDILVSTERTCLLVKKKLGSRSPRIVYVPHGAGDRNVAYHPDKAKFDLFLVSGRKYVDAGMAAGLLQADNWRIIGYPKFDATLSATAPPKLFDNGRPTFLYNPHFDPELSSWYRFGPALIEYFVANPELGNLAVAPHVMLFRKRIHYSLEEKRLRIRPNVPAVAQTAPNILIDTASPRLFDMHYTLGADVYIGDVSSQVYEFLVRPRACFFLDSHDGRSRGGENYRFWRLGPVASSVPELIAMLPAWRETADRYAPVQHEQFLHSIELGSEPASVRGAAALADYADALG